MDSSVIDRTSEGSGVEGQSSGLTGALVVDEAKVRGHLDEVVRSRVRARVMTLQRRGRHRNCDLNKTR
jgi:hypothetical protein